MAAVLSRVTLVLALALAGAPLASQEEVVVRLAPRSPDGKTSLRWSPKGAKIPLEEEAGSLRGSMRLGPEDAAPVLLALSRSKGSERWDTLVLDLDRDGDVRDETPISTKANEKRGKFWSSFSASIPVPVSDPWRRKKSTATSTFDYALNFWFVEDPEEPDAPLVIRYSRRGWMQGEARLGRPALVLVTEMQMDGVLDENDRWALAPKDDLAALLASKSARPVSRHAWLGEEAWRIVSLDPSGMKVTLTPYDPGITRAEEEKGDDHYAKDKAAAHSGKAVEFLHDFEAAAEKSRAAGKPLLVKFETTWCGPCKTMDRLVYNADLVVKAAENVIAVKIDGDESKALVKRFAVKAYPTMILLDPAEKELRRATGYQGVEAMARFLRVQ